jgi:hypothetical protein
MIPRFIVRNASTLIKVLTEMGFSMEESIPPTDILVLGTQILPAPTTEQNPLVRTFNGNKDPKGVILQARLQKNWQTSADKTELQLGASGKGKVLVTKLGVLIDQFIIPIEDFQNFRKTWKEMKNPLIASHEPLIDPTVPFMVVGCDKYSLNDLDQIISAYDKLLEPAT